MKKLFFAITLLIGVSFSLQAQDDMDVDNTSSCDVFVEAGRYSGCTFVCSNSATITSGNSGTVVSCNTSSVLNYGKIWVGEPGTSNGTYVGLCAGDRGSFMCNGNTINVGFTAPTSTANGEITVN